MANQDVTGGFPNENTLTDRYGAGVDPAWCVPDDWTVQREDADLHSVWKGDRPVGFAIKLGAYCWQPFGKDMRRLCDLTFRSPRGVMNFFADAAKTTTPEPSHD